MQTVYRPVIREGAGLQRAVKDVATKNETVTFVRVIRSLALRHTNGRELHQLPIPEARKIVQRAIQRIRACDDNEILELFYRAKFEVYESHSAIDEYICQLVQDADENCYTEYISIISKFDKYSRDKRGQTSHAPATHMTEEEYYHKLIKSSQPLELALFSLEEEELIASTSTDYTPIRKIPETLTFKPEIKVRSTAQGAVKEYSPEYSSSSNSLSATPKGPYKPNTDISLSYLSKVAPSNPYEVVPSTVTDDGSVDLSSSHRGMDSINERLSEVYTNSQSQLAHLETVHEETTQISQEVSYTRFDKLQMFTFVDGDRAECTESDRNSIIGSIVTETINPSERAVSAIDPSLHPIHSLTMKSHKTPAPGKSHLARAQTGETDQGSGHGRFGNVGSQSSMIPYSKVIESQSSFSQYIMMAPSGLGSQFFWQDTMEMKRSIRKEQIDSEGPVSHRSMKTKAGSDSKSDLTCMSFSSTVHTAKNKDSMKEFLEPYHSNSILGSTVEEILISSGDITSSNSESVGMMKFCTIDSVEGGPRAQTPLSMSQLNAISPKSKHHGMQDTAESLYRNEDSVSIDLQLSMAFTKSFSQIPNPVYTSRGSQDSCSQSEGGDTSKQTTVKSRGSEGQSYAASKSANTSKNPNSTVRVANLGSIEERTDSTASSNTRTSEVCIPTIKLNEQSIDGTPKPTILISNIASTSATSSTDIKTSMESINLWKYLIPLSPRAPSGQLSCDDEHTQATSVSRDARALKGFDTFQKLRKPGFSAQGSIRFTSRTVRLQHGIRIDSIVKVGNNKIKVVENRFMISLINSENPESSNDLDCLVLEGKMHNGIKRRKYHLKDLHIIDISKNNMDFLAGVADHVLVKINQRPHRHIVVLQFNNCTLPLTVMFNNGEDANLLIDVITTITKNQEIIYVVDTPS